MEKTGKAAPNNDAYVCLGQDCGMSRITSTYHIAVGFFDKVSNIPKEFRGGE